jgi:Ribbon-helix-helix protein, copG family
LQIYGNLYGMQKTTVYIPSDIKSALGKLATARGLSEAEVIRQALRAVTAEIVPPRPRVPLFKSGKPRLAEQMGDALKGFGET